MCLSFYQRYEFPQEIQKSNLSKTCDRTDKLDTLMKLNKKGCFT